MQFIYLLSFVAMLTFSQDPQGAGTGTAHNSEYHQINDSVRIAQLTDRALDVLFKDPQTSLILLDSALADYDSTLLDAAQANAISIKGIALSMTGDNEKGLRMFHIARKYYELNGDERNVAKCVSNLANVHRMNGRTDSACYYMIESLHHDILLHDTVRLISDYSNIAGFLIEYEDMDRASRYLEACLNLEAKSGYFEQFAIAYQLKGYLAMEAGRYEDAVKSFLSADERAERSGDERLRAILIRDIASAKSYTGDEEEARRNFNLALAVETDIGVKHHVAGIFNDFALFESRMEIGLKLEDYLMNRWRFTIRLKRKWTSPRSY